MGVFAEFWLAKKDASSLVHGIDPAGNPCHATPEFTPRSRRMVVAST
jgi:hypothetical protein